MKLGFASWEQHNLEPALLRLGERRPIDLRGTAVADRVLHLDRTASAQLDAIAEDGVRGQAVGSKAGAGIVDLEQLNRCSGAVFNRGFDLIGVAPGNQEQGREEDCSHKGCIQTRLTGCLERARPKNFASSHHSRLSSALCALSCEAWAATFFSTRSRRLSSSGSR